VILAIKNRGFNLLLY